MTPNLLIRRESNSLKDGARDFSTNLKTGPKKGNRQLQSDTKSIKEDRLRILDGLRFIAVTSVVLYHVFPDRVPGGYIGVDIFFLLSGFIIYLKYSDKLASGEVSFRYFFRNRIRRLLPAYFVFIVLTSIIALFILPPNILNSYAAGLIANGFYSQNFVFFQQGNYFVGAESRPLLHTWSLAIEEQFYLLFPIFILFLRKFRSAELLLILALVFISAILAIHFSTISSRIVFYLLPFRAWEFGMGFLAAYIYTSGHLSKVNNLFAVLLSLLGFTIVIYAILAFSATAPFPGPQSFLALGGSFIMCIFQDRLTGKIWFPITNTISQHLGHISYSWYLWHWPLLSFYFIYEGRFPQGMTAFSILVLGYLCGVLSYRYIEQAWWIKSLLNNAKNAFSGIGIFAALTLACGVFFIGSDGALFRYDSLIRPYVSAQSSNVGERCGFLRRVVMLGRSVCQRAHGDEHEPILLIGDSHSNMVCPLLTHMAEDANRTLYVSTDICRPKETGSAFCAEGYLSDVRADIEDLGIGSVVISAFWPFEFDIEEYRTVISHFSDLDVDIFVMQSPPEGPSFAPSLSNSEVYGDVHSANLINATDNRLSYLLARRKQVAAFEMLARRSDVTILQVAEAVCPGEECLFAQDGVILYMDENHISELGAAVLRSAFEPVFQQTQ